MKEVLLNFAIVMSFFFCEALFAQNKNVITQELSFKVVGRVHKAFLADGSGGKKVAGVLVIHEWWGLNDYPKSRAQMLAKQGYVAMAIDMFGDGKIAVHPKEAQAFATKASENMQETKKIFDAGVELLKNQKDVNPSKVAAIGYCFGGSVVLSAASMGEDLALVASFHGGLSSDFKMPKRENNPKVLIFNGGADPMVSADQLEAVTKALKNSGVKYEIENYPGAKHAFTNPIATKNGKKFGIPLEYNEKADKDSWEKLLVSLKGL